jgi:hypothetical protein
LGLPRGALGVGPDSRKEIKKALIILKHLKKLRIFHAAMFKTAVCVLYRLGVFQLANASGTESWPAFVA